MDQCLELLLTKISSDLTEKNPGFRFESNSYVPNDDAIYSGNPLYSFSYITRKDVSNIWKQLFADSEKLFKTFTHQGILYIDFSTQQVQERFSESIEPGLKSYAYAHGLSVFTGNNDSFSRNISPIDPNIEDHIQMYKQEISNDNDNGRDL